MFKLFGFILKILGKAAIIILIVNALSSIILERPLTFQELLAFEDLPEKIRFLLDMGVDKFKELKQGL
ncbi:MAG: hypothetical protein ACE5G1_12095 [bacterium]